MKLNLKRLSLIYWKNVFDEFLIGKREKNACSSHLPILTALPKVIRIQKVLELGSGKYSTPLFLDKSIYPNLKKIVSLENDHAWFKKVKKLVENDGRIDLVFVSDIDKKLKNLNLEDFDLIFVDHYVDIRERANTIKLINSLKLKRPLIIIHDFQQWSYKISSLGFKNKFNFSYLNPQTGILGNSNYVFRKKAKDLKKIKNLIKIHKNKISTTNIKEWRKIMDRNL